ncbi:MAG: hypothetical protein GX121_07140 [Ignavibacteria bacterium]|nr:hypothetical protein [Ignavibacteria bacterium]
MRKKLLTLAIISVSLLFFSCNSQEQDKQSQIAKTEDSAIQLIQFHSEHRCKTCNLIEKLSKEALEELTDIVFKTIVVDDPKNEKLAEEFEATGTALFIYNPKTGKKKDLTDFAFMNAKSKPEIFKKGLIDAIHNF